MTVLAWALGAAALLGAIVWVIVPYVARPAAVEAQGTSQVTLAGGVLSFLLIAGALYAVNPDHVTALRPRAVEAAVLAAVAAVVWLPVYLVAVKARIRGRRGGEEE